MRPSREGSRSRGEVIDFAAVAPINLGESGWYDWSTGLIVLNASRSDFAPEAEEMTRAESTRTFLHEAVHDLQCIYSGYMYQWCSGWNHVVIRAAGAAVREHFGPDATAHNLMQVARDVVRFVRPEHLEIGVLHVLELLSPGTGGLCILDILEAHAYLAEQDHLEASDVDRYLDQAPSPRYRAAADMAIAELGQSQGARAFPLLAMSSLLALDPVNAFTVLLHEFKRRGDLEYALKFPLHGLVVLEEVLESRGSSMAGRAVDVLNSYPGKNYRLRRAKALGVLLKNRRISLDDVFLRPWKAVVPGNNAPPVMYAKVSDREFEFQRSGLANEFSTSDTIYQADLSRRMYETCASLAATRV